MAEEITAATDSELPGRPRGSGGRGLAMLALLFALASLGGFGWLYYSLVVQDPSTGVDERLTALQAAQMRLGNDVQRLAGERQAALEAFRAELEERQRASEIALAESLEGLTVPQLPPQREPQLDEVESLLRAANRKARFEHDADAALGLLRSADGLLAATGGPETSGVRSMIASEIMSLEQADAVDPSAVYLRLHAIERRLSGLALASPEYAATDPASPGGSEDESAALSLDETGNAVASTGLAGNTDPHPAETSDDGDLRSPDEDGFIADEASVASEEPGILAALGRELGRLVRFRRFDSSLERPPAPAERDLLEFNLRLALEQTQLAALERDQAVYAASLNAAIESIQALFDTRDPRVGETVDSLEALRRLDLASPLPDISGSLNELLEARRNSP